MKEGRGPGAQGRKGKRVGKCLDKEMDDHPESALLGRQCLELQASLNRADTQGCTFFSTKATPGYKELNSTGRLKPCLGLEPR